MRVADLKNKKIVVWGTGREGKAIAAFLRRRLPDTSFTIVDESPGSDTSDGAPILRDAKSIADALNAADVVIKSPGISLYHPLLSTLKNKGVLITSLPNLWLAEPRKATVIGVTGTKGKSTTSALLVHALKALGKKAITVGNNDVPVTEALESDAEYIVVEFSSYQAALLSETCPLSILTSLYPEHLDWHQSLEAYCRDKFNLLTHSTTKIINHESLDLLKQCGIKTDGVLVFNHPSGLHINEGQIYNGNDGVGTLANAHLARRHNLINVCGALAVLQQLGFDLKASLRGMESYRGLPHRQQELGEKNGVLFVDDSISTIPEAAIVAMEAYPGRAITLIAGGHDRGLNYDALVDYILKNNIHAVICAGPSGQRIFDALKKARSNNVYLSNTMKEIAALAKELTPKNGVVLLSPAAPSYGLFKNYIERGQCFARECGFTGV